MLWGQAGSEEVGLLKGGSVVNQANKEGHQSLSLHCWLELNF